MQGCQSKSQPAIGPSSDDSHGSGSEFGYGDALYMRYHCESSFD
jgi:hypothetical protein